MGQLAAATSHLVDDPSSKTTIVLPAGKLEIPEVRLSASTDISTLRESHGQDSLVSQIGKINTIGRDISLTAPLRIDGSPIGEIAFTIRPDDTIAINAADLLMLSRPLLSRTGADRLKSLIGGKTLITAAELNGGGYLMQYDNERIGLDFFAPAQLRRPGNIGQVASKVSETEKFESRRPEQ